MICKLNDLIAVHKSEYGASALSREELDKRWNNALIVRKKLEVDQTMSKKDIGLNFIRNILYPVQDPEEEILKIKEFEKQKSLDTQERTWGFKNL